MPAKADDSSSELIELLVQWRQGKAGALDELISEAYPELRKIARSRLARERRNHSLEATALVNEACLRLLKQKKTDWVNRDQLVAVVSTLMRRVLVDHARTKQGQRKGGPLLRVSLHDWHAVDGGPDEDLIALDAAMTELAGKHPRKALVAELRFFGGMGWQEIATELGASKATVERDWVFASAWLRRRLDQS